MSKQFVNRDRELGWLENQCDENGLAVLYGRRRVGKTALMEEVMKNREAVYFLADQRPEEKNIEELQREMSDHVDEKLFRQADFDDWVELFREFTGRIDSEIVIAIDEFPYLIEQNSSIPSIFQKIWDRILKDENVTLILCGSSVRMMETHVLEYESPLYGRRTGQWQLEPLKFKGFSEFYPGTSFEEKLKFYTLLDGIPAYVLKTDPEKSFKWNLKNKILTKGTFLNEEAEFLLKQELRKPANYFAILQAIAEGSTRYGEIVNSTELNKSTVTKYLSNLQELHIVEKEYPVTQKKEGRNALYRLSDNYYSFWFNTIYPNKGMIEQNKTGKLIDRAEEKIHHLTAESFEKVCRQFTAQSFDVEEVGRWWKNQHEIDVVGIEEQKNKLVLGEAKWKQSQVGKDLLKQLEDEAELVKWGGRDREIHYVLFSKSGFTQKLENEADQRDNLELFTPGRMY
ncbi:MAG: ATP-binding protein [Candidatus Aenigmatarchaeota archaeon]